LLKALQVYKNKEVVILDRQKGSVFEGIPSLKAKTDNLPDKKENLLHLRTPLNEITSTGGIEQRFRRN